MRKLFIISFISFISACSSFSPKQHTDLGLSLFRAGDKFTSVSSSLGTPIRKKEIGSQTLFTFCESNEHFTDIANILVKNDVILDHSWQFYPQNGRVCTAVYAEPVIDDGKILTAHPIDSTRLTSTHLKNGMVFTPISNNLPIPASRIQINSLELFTFCESNSKYTDYLYVLLDGHFLIDHLLVSNKKTFLGKSYSCDSDMPQADIESKKIYSPLTDDEKRHKQSCAFEVSPSKIRVCISHALRMERLERIQNAPMFNDFLIFHKWK